MAVSFLRRKTIDLELDVPVGRPVFRFASPGDEDALARLAALDSTRIPRGDVLVASVRGELWAAVSVDHDDIAADPFRPSGELVWALLEQVRDLKRRSRRGRHGRTLIHTHEPRFV